MIGKTISHYEILDLLGKGGMGEVYRARDTKLDREVALKLLPEEVSQDSERLSRFRREAKVLASLNHPNIAQVHDLEEADGSIFLIMELAEGNDLAARLERGAIPLEEAMAIAHQIAMGVEEAHAKGVVHRDLKPANIQVSPDGKVKVLDFGLARAYAGDDSGAEDLADSPTEISAKTRQGVILGTAAYMSPEQARGKQVDRRADIWAYGVVLYEMISGRQLFAGATISDTVAAVLTREIDWSRLPQDTPARLEYLLHRCLERDCDERLRDIGEARVLLGGGDSSDSFTASAVRTTSGAQSDQRTHGRAWVRLLPWIAVLATLVLWWSGRSGGESNTVGPQPTDYLHLTKQSGVETNADIGANGMFFVYEAQEGEDLDIFFQRVGGRYPINLTEKSAMDDDQPRLSPDGSMVVFRSSRDGGGIFVMGATGESVRKVTSGGAHPSWSPDGSQIVYCTENFENAYSRNTISQLIIVGLDGNDHATISSDDAVDPSWSPHGHRIAFWAVRDTSGGQRDLWTVAPDGSDERRVTHDKALDWSPLWSADGKWLYFLSDRNGLMNLWRVPIDERTGATQGPPESVSLPAQNVSSFALSADGNGLIFSSMELRTSIVSHSFDPETARLEEESRTVLGGTLLMHSFSVSPDGEWIVFASPGQREDLFLVRRDGSALRRLTDDIHRDRGASWSPNGDRIMFYSDRNGRYDIYSIRPDGGDLTRLTVTKGRSHWFPHADPTGRRVSLINEKGTTIFEWSSNHSDLVEAAPLPEPYPGEKFYGWDWTMDGESLLGWASSTPFSEESRIVVYHLADGRYESLDLDSGYWARPSWTRDERSVVFMDAVGLVQYDLDRHQRHPLRKVAGERSGVGDHDLSETNGSLYLIERRTECDLWFAKLEGSAGPGS